MTLSAILGIPVRVYNIRAGRPKPGLAAQHLKGLELVAEMCGGKLNGASLGSTEVEFTPGKIRGGHYVADIHTAGAISLLLQVALPCALLADGPVTLDLRGGTNADMAPQIDYFVHVFAKILKLFGAHVQIQIHRRGYYPKGGGHVTVSVMPVRSFKSVDLLKPGYAKSIRGISFVAGVLPLKMALEMAEGAKEVIHDCCDDIQIDCYKEDPHIAVGNCNGIVLWCELSSGSTLGSDGLGRRGVTPRAVGAAAAERLAHALRQNTAFDPHAQDQIVVYMCLAAGRSRVCAGDPTLHTHTAIHVAEALAKTLFNIEQEDGVTIMECTGIGFLNKHIID